MNETGLGEVRFGLQGLGSFTCTLTRMHIHTHTNTKNRGTQLRVMQEHAEAPWLGVKFG